ncbi:uncharacterized protein LOC128549496 [Mercenaria mercenaria]|uniref:uncharacterized protein LOC128549496 n=1 Tax=Mercenaria mercenaria TaxID=6596 RepID=UPI00234E5BCC|nr:uncharacterized protein LOC128549496 [Mercenaria mercenaria]XP_053382191.1 uncharacterized protein LOC128549496 [Mercenaria mercenaria]
MASSEYNENWIDEISRCTEISELSVLSPDLKPDEYFYGFHGLKEEILYRVLRSDESDEVIKNEIVCKDPNSTRTVEQHIASGSKYGSRFISTTTDREVAALWAFYKMETPERKPRDKPLRIVKITVEKLVGTETEKKCINLCNKEVREHFIKGATHRSWAISSKEVLFQYRIPKYVQNAELVYYLATDIPKPPQPPPKKPKSKAVSLEESMANLKFPKS